MKLVGATKWFIMRPSLGSSITQGILSGIIASALFTTAVYGLNEAVPELMSLAETMKIGIIVGGMVLGGIDLALLHVLRRQQVRQHEIQQDLSLLKIPVP